MNINNVARPEGHIAGRIAIVGALPTPYGGVSIHLKRQLPYLDKHGIPYTFYNTGPSTIQRHNVVNAGRARWIAAKLFTFEEDVIHFHNSRQFLLMVATWILTRRNKRVVWTFHDEFMLNWYERAGRLSRASLACALKRLTHAVCVNPRIRDWLVEAGVPVANTTIAPAFIGPTDEETSPDNLSSQMSDFLTGHTPIIGSHGWFGMYINGKDVYSLEMIAAMISRVRKEKPSVGCYTVISGTADAEFRQRIMTLRRDSGLENCWLIIETPFSAAALYARTDVFVRPSLTDGDSVSVRECLSLGVPVIASDAVWRPQRCVLFPSGDQQAFNDAVLKMLGGRPTADSGDSISDIPDYGMTAVNLYHQILSHAQSAGPSKEV